MSGNSVDQHREKIAHAYTSMPNIYQNSSAVLNMFRGTLKLCDMLAPEKTANWVIRLFLKPQKQRLSKAGEELFSNADESGFFQLNEEKRVKYYSWGQAAKKVLLVHGWASRASDFTTIIKDLRTQGFQVIAFDAPAHGESSGSFSDMSEFIRIILQMEAQFGPIAATVGHSFGGLAVINAAKEGFKTDKIVVISAPTSFYGLVDKFALIMALSQRQKQRLTENVERHFNSDSSVWLRYAGYIGVEELGQQGLIIYAENDKQVLTIEGECLAEAWSNANFILMPGLGHKKILGDKKVIDTIVDHLNLPTKEVSLQEAEPLETAS